MGSFGSRLLFIWESPEDAPNHPRLKILFWTQEPTVGIVSRSTAGNAKHSILAKVLIDI